MIKCKRKLFHRKQNVYRLVDGFVHLLIFGSIIIDSHLFASVGEQLGNSAFKIQNKSEISISDPLREVKVQELIYILTMT